MIIDTQDIEEMIKEHLSEEQYDVVCDLANFYNSRKDKIKSITFGVLKTDLEEVTILESDEG